MNVSRRDLKLSADELRLIKRYERGMGAVGTKWKPAIIYCLIFGGPLRFSDFRRLVPGITQKMLTQRLRELERDGLVRRTLYAEVPTRVEYELTGLGKSLTPILSDFCDWAEANGNTLVRANDAYDRRT